MTGCCPECGDIVELEDGQVPTHYSTGSERPCAGSGSEPEGAT